MNESFSGSVIVSSEVHPSKAHVPISVTVSGNSTALIQRALLQIKSGTFVVPSANVTFSTLLQRKTFLPSLKVLGNVISVSAEPENISLPVIINHSGRSIVCS